MHLAKIDEPFMNSASKKESAIVIQVAARYAGFSLDADLQLPGCGVTVIFGHSGSGKTTLLRTVAGLERHAGTYLSVDGEVWQDDSSKLFLPTYKRRLGYVFQEPSLFAHLSVQKNLQYGLRRNEEAERHVHLDNAIELLGIGHLLVRRPSYLSGGERQRVAIARALASAPRLLLLDEPLASLDIGFKQEILPYLERLREELSMPIIYVTHSPEEMARLADHVVLLDAGQVKSSLSLQETLGCSESSRYFADELGVVVEGNVTAIDAYYGLMRITFGAGAIQVVHRNQSIGTRLRVRIKARDVSVALAPQKDVSILNQFRATVIDQSPAPDGAQVMVRLTVENTPMLAQITRRSRDELQIEAGKTVWVQVKAVAVLA